MPERFLRDGVFAVDPAHDPHDWVFGFGRRYALSPLFALDVSTARSHLMGRTCPGRHLADGALFIMCASILHAFEISPGLDEHGAPAKLEAKFTTHLLTSWVSLGS